MGERHGMHAAAAQAVRDGGVGIVGHHTEGGYYAYTYGRAALGRPDYLVVGEHVAEALAMLRAAVQHDIGSGIHTFERVERPSDRHHGFHGTFRAGEPRKRRDVVLEYHDVVGGGPLLELRRADA